MSAMLKKDRSDWAVIMLLFLLGFMGTYLALSYAVPMFRLPLDTPTENYAAENLRHMFLPKCAGSLVVGAVMGMIPRTLSKK